MSISTCVTSGTSRGLLKIEEDAKANERQGIGSILGSEPDRPKTAASLRRTLSADMSSKKWLGRHGFTHLKKIPSSESFPLPSTITSSDSSSSSLSSSEGEEEDEEQQKEEDLERPGLSDIWGSILSQKVENSSKLSSALSIPAPVKRSKRSLSQKSLEICTESLGSETGSDGFNEKSAEEQLSPKETEQIPSEAVLDFVPTSDQVEATKDNNSVTKKSPARSFPPPLPSLCRREGPGVLMQSHRIDGRLVLEAIPVSSYNYFNAERQGGRLLLSFINKPSSELIETNEEEVEEEIEELEDVDVFDEFQGFEEEETERVDEKVEEVYGVQDRGIVSKVVKGSQPTPRVMVPNEVINVHRSAATLTAKLMGLTNKNPTWSHSHKKNVYLLEEEEDEDEDEEEEMEEEETKQLPQSLPCPPRVARLVSSPADAATASFNAYDYFWRTKPSAAAAATMHLNQQPPLPPPPHIVDNNNCCYYPNKLHNKKTKSNNNKKSVISKGGLKPHEQQKQILVSRGNEADCLVPPVRGCKEPIRSLLIWQPPRCIATS